MFKKIAFFVLFLLVIVLPISYGINYNSSNTLKLVVEKRLQEIQALHSEGFIIKYKSVESSPSLFSSGVKVEKLSIAAIDRSLFEMEHTGEIFFEKSLGRNSYSLMLKGLTILKSIEFPEELIVDAPVKINFNTDRELDIENLEEVSFKLEGLTVFIDRGSFQSVDRGGKSTNYAEFDLIQFSFDEEFRNDKRVDFSFSSEIKNLSFPGLAKDVLESKLQQVLPASFLYPSEYGLINYRFKGLLKLPTEKSFTALSEVANRNPETFFREMAEAGYGIQFESEYSDALADGTGELLVESSGDRELYDFHLFSKVVINLNFSKFFRAFVEGFGGALAFEDELGERKEMENMELFLREKGSEIKNLIGDSDKPQRVESETDLVAEWKGKEMPESFKFRQDLLIEGGYGYKLDLFANGIEAVNPPKGKATIILLRYEETIDRVTAFFNKLSSMYLELFPDEKGIYLISEEDVKYLKDMLQLFSSDPQAVDLEILFDFTDPTNPKVGNMSMFQLMMMMQVGAEAP